MTRARRISLVLFAVGLCALLAPDRAFAASKKVDLNSATQQELETLPGVGEAIAKKIVAGRPYSSVADLARAGVPDATIQKITPLVRAGRASASSSSKAEKPASAEKAEKSAKPTSTESASPGKSKSASAAPASETGARTGSAGSSSSASASGATPSSSPVDLNSAGAKDLEALPGVGPATAKKIIAGRPYAAVADLSRAGVSASTITKISPLVRVSAPESARKSTSASSTSAQTGSAVKPAPARPASSAEPASAAAPASPAPSGASAPAPTAAAAVRAKPAPSADAGGATYQPPPSAGMVWVNLDSKVFHREGDRWYGKTKHGKYMLEADAVQAGYRASKQSPN